MEVENFLQRRRLRQNPTAYSFLFSFTILGFPLIENGIGHIFHTTWIESWRNEFVGQSQENTQVRNRQADVESKWHSAVSKIAIYVRTDDSETFIRKENQLKQKKKEEEAKEKAVRRVSVPTQVSPHNGC